MTELSLDTLIIPTPCAQPWGKMKGDARTRHCDSCEKSVYNLSELTRFEAERLLIEKEGKLCLKYYQRSDGTILTNDCAPVFKALRRGYLYAKARSGLFAMAVLSIFGISLIGCVSEVIGVPPSVYPDSLRHKQILNSVDTLPIPTNTN